MKHGRLALSVVVLLVITVVAGTALATGLEVRRDFTEAPAPAAVTREYIMIKFQDPPAASYEGGIPGLERTKPLRGKFDLTSPAAQAYLKHLDNVHANYRSWLARNAKGAEIVREYRVVFNGMAIKLNGVRPERVAGGPGVVARAFSSLYHPTMNVSTGLIRATEVWGELGGPASAGSGVKVAVIDTGIDLTNSFFDDTGYAATSQIDACEDQDADPATPDTNNKVVVCRVYTSGVALGAAQPFPALFFDHGTHVAGTVAGNANTTGVVQGTTLAIEDLSGVAPGALLGNYNVFPGFGAGFWAFDGSAFSHDIAAALEDAVLDGMDVANMSIGGSVQGPHDFLAEASNSTVDAGMVVVVAAGNAGPGDATMESPGSAEKVITAGASTNPHFAGILVTVQNVGSFGAALGDFLNFDPAITADFSTTTPANGCSAIAEDLAGQIAVIDRGVCTFGTKIRNAEAAGAIGAIIANNVAGDPVAMGTDGGAFPNIPAAMISQADGAVIKPSAGVEPMTVDGTTIVEFLTGNADIIAGFSGRGPVPFTGLIKPDLTAPGVNVLSSVFDGEFAFFQGTSMATPHTSGAAALILHQYPGASPAEVKSRLVNSAARVVLDHVTGASDPGVMARGGGRIDLVEAFDAATFFDPVSVSFGEVTGNRKVSKSMTIATSGDAITLVSVTGDVSADLTVTAAVTNSSIVVTMEAARTLADGDYEGDIVVEAGGQAYLVPWWVRIINR